MPTGLTPYNLADLLGGPGVRVLIGEVSPEAEDLNDVQELVGPDYSAISPFEDLGATTDASSYSREFKTSAQTIEQTTVEVLEELDETIRQFQVPVGEISAEHLQLFEQAPDVEDIDAVPGVSTAQKKVAFGNPESLNRYQVAFVARRPKGGGSNVTEPDGSVRGTLVCGVLWSAQLAADSSELKIAQGDLSALPITFKAFPVDGHTAGQEVGMWLTEEPGTISGS